jgi:N-acetylmuramoyl-L-alanine amidase
MKKSVKIVAMAAIAACFAFGLPKTGTPKQINVVIDAAHGGKDFGASINGFTEKQLTDVVADKIKNLNTDSEVVIHFTRVDDAFVSLEDRVSAINTLHPDLVVSLHVNAERGNTKSGMEFFISDQSNAYKKSAEYAEMLSGKFESQKFKVKEVAKAPFYMLKKTNAPVVQFEMGYLSNEADRSYLTSPEGQEQIAATVLSFIKEIK